MKFNYSVKFTVLLALIKQQVAADLITEEKFKKEFGPSTGFVPVTQAIQRDELVIVHASSEGKEYWVPREHVTVGVQSSDSVGYLIQQLCYIFHRSRTMASHKENYPCQSRSNALMLFNPKTKFKYHDVNNTLKRYKIKNGTRLYLFYS